MTYLVTAKRKKQFSEYSTAKENDRHGKAFLAAEEKHTEQEIQLLLRLGGNLKRIQFIISLASCTITYDSHCLFGMEVSNYL